MSRAAVIGATGFGLIAVCYGLARYAFGLFLPPIAAELALTPAASGFISGAAFLSYCVAIGMAAWLTERIGPRSVALGAGVAAALGMAGMAAAPSAAWLCAAVILAGSSTGLASPPLAAAVAAGVAQARQDTVNTVINAGTSAGVALSGPVALLMGAQWRLAFACFAGAALAMALAAWRCLPQGSTGGTGASGTGPANGQQRGQQRGQRGLPVLSPDLRRLILATFLTGVASAVVWAFGAELAAANLDWPGERAGLLWIAVGIAGIAGAAAGWLVARQGVNPVLRALQGASLLAIAGVGCDSGLPALVMASGALFGAAYMLLSGVYLLWGVSALPERPATGVMLAFLTLSVGQALGAASFGALQGYVATDAAVLGFAALSLLAAAVGRTAPAASAGHQECGTPIKRAQ